MALKGNLLANYLGQGWTALMGLAFIPLYIRYLGVEAYGVIGLFIVLQAWLVILDMGLMPMLSREMGRFTGGVRTAESVRDLLRSVELVMLPVAFLIVLLVVSISNWLANSWLKVEDLPIATVIQALCLMGAVAALQFIQNIYRSSLVGLQRQIPLNLIVAIAATLRALGAIAVLAWVSPTLEVFFVWQLIISIILLAVLAVLTYAYLPKVDHRAKFSLSILKDVGRYAGGMMIIAVLSLLLTQADKILLSKFLNLSEYGYYVLAVAVSGGVLSMLLVPIVQAWFPRLSQLHAEGESAEFVKAYHLGAQLVSVVVGSATIILIVYAELILRLWTQDAELVQNTSRLVRLLAFGNLLNALMTMPYQAQLATGWTSFGIFVNSISVALIVPAILWVVPRYGAEGAALIWVTLNAGYILLGVHFMYRRILIAEKWRWYKADLISPLLSGSLAAYLIVLVMPAPETTIGAMAQLLASSMVVFIFAVIGAKNIRIALRLALHSR
ncbi:oligosaccharide flippase family protein [Marinobacter alexandrii]|uniref:oligosaccharide flippase family protein n=1 Tax=Marinobacter alexandrii TaxID=2570351 RepID=UPI003298FD51